jgi:hypothetical protein
MPRKSYTIEQIISKLREAEVLLGQGQTVGDICRSFNISEQTYYRWRKEYGGIRTDQVRRLKELEKENARLTSSRCPSGRSWWQISPWIIRSCGRQSGETDQPGQAQASSGERPGSVSGI